MYIHVPSLPIVVTGSVVVDTVVANPSLSVVVTGSVVVTLVLVIVVIAILGQPDRYNHYK